LNTDTSSSKRDWVYQTDTNRKRKTAPARKSKPAKNLDLRQKTVFDEQIETAAQLQQTCEGQIMVKNQREEGEFFYRLGIESIIYRS